MVQSLLARRALLSMLAAGLAATTSGACAATVVETQRIMVDPARPLDGKPSAVETGSPEIHRPGAESQLPPAVAAMRQTILDVCYSGDMAKLKALIDTIKPTPAFSINEITDPIDYLKSQSGDGAGLEILALMTDVLEAGWAHVDIGSADELYVFPYYAVLPMDKLTPAQLVDLYKIVTSGDFEEMKSTGIYSFYALGIAPDGAWKYFKPNN